MRMDNSFTQNLTKINLFFSFQQTILYIFLFLWAVMSLTKIMSKQFLFWGCLGGLVCIEKIKKGEYSQQ